MKTVADYNLEQLYRDKIHIQSTEDVVLCQTCILSDYLTEADNGVMAMERLTLLVKCGVLVFKRDCDINEKSDPNKFAHDILLVIPKGTKFSISRKQGTVLNGKHRGETCWYYYFVPDNYPDYAKTCENFWIDLDYTDITWFESFIVC